MSAIKVELEAKIEELQEENEELRDRLDQIAAISGTEEEDEGDGICDDDEQYAEEAMVGD